jgi:hypothetical protein
MGSPDSRATEGLFSKSSTPSSGENARGFRKIEMIERGNWRPVLDCRFWLRSHRHSKARADGAGLVIWTV